MKKLIKTMKDAIQKFSAKVCAKAEILRLKLTAYIRPKVGHIRLKLAETRGDFVMDHAVVFVIILVVGGAALLLLTTFLNTDMGPLLTQKIKDFFN